MSKARVDTSEDDSRKHVVIHQDNHRLETLLSWAKYQLFENQVHCSEKSVALEPLQGDASFRCYYRLTASDNSWIIMDSPVAQEDPTTFVRVGEWWYSKGIATPKIIAKDVAQGLVLLEDLGQQELASLVGNEASVCISQSQAPSMSSLQTTLYEEALTIADQIQRLPLNYDSLFKAQVPLYDEQLLRAEMELFSEWFLPCFYQKSLYSKNTHQLCIEWERLNQDIYTPLVNNALMQPQVWVHRDFHSRNLMMCSNRLRVIDFQDAVLGPITYDWVSLLRDCYSCWSFESEAYLLRQLFYRHPLIESTFGDYKAFFQAYEWMGLQRHLKVLGIFTRLYLRDGKARYLKYLPRVYNYALQVARRYEDRFAFLIRVLEAINLSDTLDRLTKEKPCKR